MESPGFCGQTCHTPMHPQFTAWQDAPHSRVACVAVPHRRRRARTSCTTSWSASGSSYHVVTGRLPAADPGVSPTCGRRSRLCGNCHSPGRGFGDRVRIMREYADDEANTETMHDPADARRRTRTADRRRAAPSTGTPIPRVQRRVRRDRCRSGRRSLTCRVTDAKGQVREYVAEGTTPASSRRAQRRTMDCIDCHNVVAHRDLADAGAGRRSRHRRRQDQPRPALRPARRRPAAESGAIPSEDAGLRGDRRGIAGVLRASAAAPSTPGRSTRRSTSLQDGLPPQRVSRR